MRIKTRELTLCAVLAALALALSYMESFFPLALIVPLPGVKLGLAQYRHALRALCPRLSERARHIVCALHARRAVCGECLGAAVLAARRAVGAFGDGAFERGEKAQHFRRLDRGAAAHNCGRSAPRSSRSARPRRSTICRFCCWCRSSRRAQRPDHCILVPRNGAHALRNEGRESTWIKRTRSFSSSSTLSAR